MVHIGSGPPGVDDVLALMRPGDILTHCFTGGDMRILGADGVVNQAARALQQEGVILDIGHGTGSFSFEVAEAMLQDAVAGGDEASIRRAAQMVKNARWYQEARRFGELVTQEPDALGEPVIVATGGGPGIMEAGNRGAFEAGGRSMGMSIFLPFEEAPNPYITPELCFQFHYFAIRKMHFLMRAVALVSFPGGMGTLDELFEVLTLVQTKKAKPVPILLFGTDYWKRLINFDVLVEEGTISPEDLELFQYVDDPQVAWEAILRFYDMPN